MLWRADHKPKKSINQEGRAKPHFSGGGACISARDDRMKAAAEGLPNADIRVVFIVHGSSERRRGNGHHQKMNGQIAISLCVYNGTKNTRVVKIMTGNKGKTEGEEGRNALIIINILDETRSPPMRPQGKDEHTRKEELRSLSRGQCRECFLHFGLLRRAARAVSWKTSQKPSRLLAENSRQCLAPVFWAKAVPCETNIVCQALFIFADEDRGNDGELMGDERVGKNGLYSYLYRWAHGATVCAMLSAAEKLYRRYTNDLLRNRAGQSKPSSRRSGGKKGGE
ncbi:hypothetical protein BKA70DRAFT_1232159 [Coprinopsis sp. MPI-PUGE-AT-0042]|nr:hypothetical protein BKA70DRAFT_1232159 [Coprinopsis sp. MPI-PUGE-AT-0042]